MKNRVLYGLTYFSSALLLGALILSFYAARASPYPPLKYVSFGSKLNVTAISGWGGRIVVFNDANGGPYLGSIVAVGSPNPQQMGPIWPIVNGWDNKFFGIYFRSLKYPAHSEWTFMISIWYANCVFGVLPLIALIKLWRKWKTRIANSG